MTAVESIRSVDDVAAALDTYDYLADDGLATSIFLSIRLRRPLLLEGEAGVGKTEVAKVLSRWTGGDLIRLQCYEGIDVSQAVYEWDDWCEHRGVQPRQCAVAHAAAVSRRRAAGAGQSGV
jgi:MoxR-like ATPase